MSRIGTRLLSCLLFFFACHCAWADPLPAVQALFEEVSKISELVDAEKALVFVGDDMRPLFEVARQISQEDTLARPEFALQDRIHWIPRTNDLSGLPERARARHLMVLSKNQARNERVEEDCDADLEHLRILVLPLNAGEGGCTRENFLESLDGAWNRVSPQEILAFSENSRTVKFFALKRRLWRHLFKLTQAGQLKEAVEVLGMFVNDPSAREIQVRAVKPTLADFREFVRRYFAATLADFDRAIARLCQASLKIENTHSN
jgi:hypothetical protein